MDMANILGQVQRLVACGQIRISAHGYDELAADGLLVRDVVEALPDAELVREYPDYGKGPCVLVLLRLPDGAPVHAVWGIPRGKESPAVLVTSYRPDPGIWEADFKTRKES